MEVRDIQQVRKDIIAIKTKKGVPVEKDGGY